MINTYKTRGITDCWVYVPCHKK